MHRWIVEEHHWVRRDTFLWTVIQRFRTRKEARNYIRGMNESYPARLYRIYDTYAGKVTR